VPKTSPGPVKLLEFVALAWRGVEPRELRAIAPDLESERHQRRLLKRLRDCGMIRVRLWRRARKGPPAYKYQAKPEAHRLLKLLGHHQDRYLVTWRELRALAEAVRILHRRGSLRTVPKARRPFWSVNAAYSE
jgi:hypothetical protein